MKKFMAIYLGSDSNDAFKKWNSLDENSKREKEIDGKTAWGKWVMANKSSILDLGGPLGKTKCVDVQGISHTKNRLTAYTIVQAESHEEAAKLFLNHPHFTIFPGDSVEIIECLPLPNV